MESFILNQENEEIPNAGSTESDEACLKLSDIEMSALYRSIYQDSRLISKKARIRLLMKQIPGSTYDQIAVRLN